MTIPQLGVENRSQRAQGSGVEGVSWTSSAGDRLRPRPSCCCCHCRSLFSPSLSPFSSSPPPPSLSHVAGGAPPPPPVSGVPLALAGALRLVSSIRWCGRARCRCGKQGHRYAAIHSRPNCTLGLGNKSTAVHEQKRMENLEKPDLSLSEDEEGARFAGAGLGFRPRGFGGGFSVDGKEKHEAQRTGHGWYQWSNTLLIFGHGWHS